MTISVTFLEKALISLKKSLSAQKDSDNFIRDSAIQRFEYTYELSIKLLRKQLIEISEYPEEIKAMEFRTMIRTAADSGLVDNPVDWFDFREKRNITTHTYDEEKAEMIYAILPGFVGRVEYLLGSLKRYNQ